MTTKNSTDGGASAEFGSAMLNQSSANLPSQADTRHRQVAPSIVGVRQARQPGTFAVFLDNVGEVIVTASVLRSYERLRAAVLAQRRALLADMSNDAWLAMVRRNLQLGGLS
jgi:hypothetical protein